MTRGPQEVTEVASGPRRSGSATESGRVCDQGTPRSDAASAIGPTRITPYEANGASPVDIELGAPRLQQGVRECRVCFVRGFAYLTATILVAIAIGVAVSAVVVDEQSLTNASPQGSAFWAARDDPRTGRLLSRHGAEQRCSARGIAVRNSASRSGLCDSEARPPRRAGRARGTGDFIAWVADLETAATSLTERASERTSCTRAGLFEVSWSSPTVGTVLGHFRT